MRILATVFLAVSATGCCCHPCCPPLASRCCPPQPPLQASTPETPVTRTTTSPAPTPAPKNAALALAQRHGRGSGAVWSFLAASYDKDKDARIVADEYPRDAKTFKRLDRDADGALTAADFAGPTDMEEYLAQFVWRRLMRFEDDPPGKEGPEGGAEPRPLDAALLAKSFGHGDADANGRLTERELTNALRTAEAKPTKAMPDMPKGVRVYPVLLDVQDGDKSGDLTLAEVQAWAVGANEEMQKEMEAAKAQAAKRAAESPSPEPRADPARARPGAKVGEAAPPFSLPTREGGAEVSLASFAGKKPVALIFGSYTCPPFRYSATRLRQIVALYGNSVQFLFIYVREAHSVDGRAPMPSEDQPIVEEPTTAAERTVVANLCALDLGFDRFPTLVDGMDNAVAKAYAGPPARLYVIDRAGKITYGSEPGPFGLDPAAFEAAILKAIAP